MSNAPILNPHNKTQQPPNRTPIQSFQTDYTVYNSYRYPILAPHSGVNLNRQRSDSRSIGREKQVNLHTVGANLGRVRSMESFGTQQKPNRQCQYTVITELPDLQYSQSRFQVDKSTTRTNPPIKTQDNLNKNRSISKYKQNQSMVQLQAELENLKQQTIYKTKQTVPTGHEKQQAYFALFAAKSKLNNMKKSHITRNNGSNSIQNKEQTKQSIVQELGNMRKQYNRLRNYLQSLEQSSRKMKQQNQQITISNTRLQQELKLYRNGKSRLCQVCNNSNHSHNIMKNSQSRFNSNNNHNNNYNNGNNNKGKFRQDSFADNSPKNIGSSAMIRSTNSIQSDASMFDLLNKAKQQILARDQIIANLQTQINQITIHTINTIHNNNNSNNNNTIPPPMNKLNPISPFDVQDRSPAPLVDPNIYGNIQRIKQYIETMNTQYNRLTSQIDLLTHQLNQITNKVQQCMIKYDEQQHVLLQKELQIEVHMKYTRQILAKLGYEETGVEEESSEAETMNQKQFEYNTFNYDIPRKIGQQTYQWYNKTAETTNLNFTEPRSKGSKNMRELLSTGQMELASGLVCLCFYSNFLERQMY